MQRLFLPALNPIVQNVLLAWKTLLASNPALQTFNAQLMLV